jgi:5-methylcytosine-specific restriction protein A
MATQRWHETYSTKQVMGTNGRLACLECAGDITEKRRSTFCGKKCADAFRIKTSCTAVRFAVFERYKGICANCRGDVFDGQFHRNGSPVARRARGSGHLWQADHIVPVVEGGGACGLDNYRTLCTACHKAETAALRARMAGRTDPRTLPKQIALLAAD